MLPASGSANRPTSIKVIENGNTVKVLTTKVNYKESVKSLKKILEMSIKLRPDEPNYEVTQVFIKSDGVFEEITEENIETIRTSLYHNKDILLKKVILMVNVNIVTNYSSRLFAAKHNVPEKNQETNTDNETKVLKNLYYSTSPLRSASKSRSLSRGRSPLSTSKNSSSVDDETTINNKPRIRNISPCVSRPVSTPSIKNKVEMLKSTSKSTSAGIHVDHTSNELMKMFESNGSIGSSKDYSESISSTASTLEFRSPIAHRTSIAEVNQKLQQSAQKLISRTWHDVCGSEDNSDMANSEDFLSKIETYSPIRNPTGVTALLCTPAINLNIDESIEDTNEVETGLDVQDEIDDTKISNAIESDLTAESKTALSPKFEETMKSPDTIRKNKMKVQQSLSRNLNTSKSTTVSTSGQPVYPEGRTGGESVVHYDLSLRKDTTNVGNKNSSKIKPTLKASPPFKSPKSKRNPDGRPSIGTIENQWEFMKITYFNNNDEELEWTMVSKGKGAYHHAHKKYELSEDKYFKGLFEIDFFTRKLSLLTTGSCAKIIKTIELLKDHHPTYYAINKRVESPQLKEAEEKVLSLQAELKSLVEFDRSMITEIFSEKSAEAIFKLANNIKKETLTTNARTLYADLPVQVQMVRNKLVSVRKESEEALINMEKWSKRERETNDYHKVMKDEENQWLDEQLQNNTEALNKMRSLIPVTITNLSINELMEAAKTEGGHYSLELAIELKQNRLLHWVITHPEDIATSNFLTGEKKSFFENLECLDIVEMRAIAACMPAKFELDHDGKKAEWRMRFMSRVKQLSNQEVGVCVKGAWNQESHSRALVKLPNLKPEQMRRSVYYYRTKLQSDIKMKMYNSKHTLLDKKLKELTEIEIVVKDAKEEYDTLLKESRDKDFAELYAEKMEIIQKAKEIAKSQKDDSEKLFKKLSYETEKLKETIRSIPLSREQFIANEQELKDYLCSTQQTDWDLHKDLILIESPFNPDPIIIKVEKETAKFVSAEVEAELRRIEMNALMAGKEVVDLVGDTDQLVNPLSTTTSKVQEGRRLTTALLANFNHNNAENTSSAPLLFTPNKRKNSVLHSYANPEMLSTLNRMLISASPVPTSKYSNRSSILGTFKYTTNTNSTTTSLIPEDGEERKKLVLKQTKSKLLRKLLEPKSALSPKRNSLSPKTMILKSHNPIMKLSFLDQLKARTNKEHSISNDSLSVVPPIPDTVVNTKSITNVIECSEDKENDAKSSNKMLPTPQQISFIQKGIGQQCSKMPSSMMSIFDDIKLRRTVD